jgi:hypothetical protein
MSKEITLQLEVDNDNLAGVVAAIQAAVNVPTQTKPLKEVRVNGRALNPTTFNTAQT